MKSLAEPLVWRGSLDWHGFQSVQKVLHVFFERQGADHVVLSLDLDKAFPNGVVPLVLLLDFYREQQGKEICVSLEKLSSTLRKIFDKNNWSHFLSPGEYAVSAASTPSSLRYFGSDSELNELIDREIEAILGKVRFADGVAQGFEWTLNEIAGNALVHSGKEGGFMQVVVMPQSHHLAIVVADGGVGIPASIRKAFPEFVADEAAVEHALKKGVTSRPDFGQGKGLTGALEIVRENQGGRFEVHSGKAWVALVEGRFLIRSDFPPMVGTVVDIQLDTAQPINVSKALWGHQPVSFTETIYGSETPEGVMRLRLSQEARSFGNRITAERIRTKIENLLRSEPTSVLEVDFSGVDLVASSFADEIFGKLAVGLGIVTFSRRLRLINLNNFCHSVIDDVVQARMAQQVSR